MKRKLIIFLGVFSSVLFPISIFPFQNMQTTPEEILLHVQSTFADIKDYTVKLHAEIEMPDINIPPMDVTLYFKQPDKIHLQSEGFAILPREGMFINPNQFNKEHFYASLLGRDTLQNIETYKLELVPRTDEIITRKFIIWVDPERWLILRLYTISGHGQSSEINFAYNKIQNSYWLPTTAIANLYLIGFKGFNNTIKIPGQQENKTAQENMKKGKLTVRFSNYKVNNGLSDSIFETE